jgi:serine/threonine-protein kinase RsbW
MRAEATFEARLDRLAEIRGFVEDACRAAAADPAACAELRLAVDEACTNVVEHAYGGAGGPIRVSFEADGELVRVVISDRGAAFDPLSLPSADVDSGWQERRIGGLGWHLIRRSVDEINYEPDPSGGNRLTLVKRSRPWRSG